MNPQRVAGFAPLQNGKGNAVRCRQPLVECPYFRLHYLQDTEPISVGGTERMQVVLVLRGQGRLVTPAGEEELRAGQTWVVPASLPQVWCRPQPDLGLLVSTLP